MCHRAMWWQAGSWLVPAERLCRPAGLEPSHKVVLSPGVTRHQLDELQPNTKYRFTLYTLLEGREVATPATVVPTGECIVDWAS